MPFSVNTNSLIGLGIHGLFFILLFFFVIQAVFLTYHWFKYGTKKHTSILALAMYLSGGAVLFLLYAISLSL